jgi:hypothetical protein
MYNTRIVATILTAYRSHDGSTLALAVQARTASLGTL